MLASDQVRIVHNFAGEHLPVEQQRIMLIDRSKVVAFHANNIQSSGMFVSRIHSPELYSSITMKYVFRLDEQGTGILLFEQAMGENKRWNQSAIPVGEFLYGIGPAMRTWPYYSNGTNPSWYDPMLDYTLGAYADPGDQFTMFRARQDIDAELIPVAILKSERLTLDERQDEEQYAAQRSLENQNEDIQPTALLLGDGVIEYTFVDGTIVTGATNDVVAFVKQMKND